MAAVPLNRNGDFALLWGGQTVSELGTQLSTIAYPLLVLALTGSAAKAGVVAFAKALPIALFALPAGALADRVNRKHLMVACDGARAVALATIPIALTLGRVPYSLIVGVAFVDGAGFVVSYITERGALRRLVAREQLPDAVARNESRTFAAMLAGPPLGGLLFGLGRAVPFLADALTYAVSSVAMLAIRADFQEARAEPGSGDVREGMRWLWGRPFFRDCALLAAGANPIFTGLYLLVVLLAHRDGASAELIGAMLAIGAGGGLLGTLLAPALQRRLAPRRAAIVEVAVVAAVLPLLLAAHHAVLYGMVVAAAELAAPTVNAIVIGQRVAAAPDRLQGRVQAASTLVSFSAGWAGPLLIGLLFQHAGASAAVIALAGWAAIMLVLTAASPGLRRGPPRGAA